MVARQKKQEPLVETHYMCKIMPHFGYHLPWRLRVRLAESFGQIINGLANNHGMIDYPAKQQFVGCQIIACHTIAALNNDVDGINNIKEAIPIFKLLSHK